MFKFQLRWFCDMLSMEARLSLQTILDSAVVIENRVTSITQLNAQRHRNVSTTSGIQESGRN